MANQAERGRNTRNINLSDNDLARLLSQGQPGNVTGGRDPIPDPMLRGLTQQSSTPQSLSPVAALALQRQMERDSFGLGPANEPQLPTAPNNPVKSIMEQLSQLMSGKSNMESSFTPTSLPTFDPNRYKKEAETAVNSQFDPIIQELYSQQGLTRKRAGENKQAVAGLYQGAVNDINLGAAQTQKGYDQTQAASQKLYTDERNRIAAAYAADAAAQRAEAKKLGTEALGVEEAIAKQNADKNFADQLGSQQMQSSQSALGAQEQAAADYDKSIAQATRAEGIEQQTDINRQLEDLLAQSNQDIAGVRSQAAGSIQDLMLRLAEAGYNRDAANAQFQYQQQRDFIGDQNNLYDRQYKALMDQLQMQLAAQEASGAGSADKLNPWQQVANFAESLKPGQGSDIVSAIQNAMSNRGEIYARSKDDPVPMNPALFAKLIADYPQNANMDRATLMQVSQELYRLLYGT
jgi:hypothetical protein